MNREDQSKDFVIPLNERINYYLNYQDSFTIDFDEFEKVKRQTYWNKREMRLISYSDYENTFTHWYCKHLVQLPLIRNIRVIPFLNKYRNLHSLMNFLMPFDQVGMAFKDTKYPLYYGEAGETDSIPCIRKCRKSDDHLSVLYNFKTLRHMAPCSVAKLNDSSWNDKFDNVIWRGATTGKVQRVDFVEKYFDQYDVGFATIKQKPHLRHLKKAMVSIKEQLKYKFIISLEGNDFASNLRWVLASNSVPIMTKPYWQSWIIEQNLVPFVHYLELNEDMSNLEELLHWAVQNDDQCNQIAQNGKKYMSQFLDVDNDLIVQKTLLEEYAKRVTYKN